MRIELGTCLLVATLTIFETVSPATQLNAYENLFAMNVDLCDRGMLHFVIVCNAFSIRTERINVWRGPASLYETGNVTVLEGMQETALLSWRYSCDYT